MKSIAEGLEVIVKFFANDNPKSQNKIVTRTLGKLGVIQNNQTNINPNEFWRVQIIKETCPHRNTGCFILEPVAKLLPEELSKVVPGMYTEVRKNGLVIITPLHPGNWIIPLLHKRGIMHQNKTIYAVLVDLSQINVPAL